MHQALSALAAQGAAVAALSLSALAFLGAGSFGRESHLGAHPDRPQMKDGIAPAPATGIVGEAVIARSVTRIAVCVTVATSPRETVIHMTEMQHAATAGVQTVEVALARVMPGERMTVVRPMLDVLDITMVGGGGPMTPTVTAGAKRRRSPAVATPTQVDPWIERVPESRSSAAGGTNVPCALRRNVMRWRIDASCLT